MPNKFQNYPFFITCLSIINFKMTTSNQALVVYDESIVPRHFLNLREVSIGDFSLQIIQDWQSIGIAAVLWDSAIVLGEYLHKNPDLVRNKSIIEVGAGTGLPGMIACRLDAAEVVLTDRSLALDSLKKNVEVNSLNESIISVRELEWGVNLKDYDNHYDLIIAADIIYIEETFEKLLETLRHLSSQKNFILLTCKIRYQRDEKFLNLLKERDFVVTRIGYDKARDIILFKITNKS
ncbi:DgyrCDS12435 [Dimorphilus gyrociliatus]|uniref:DgyrCDS12435 n=1 Tax=Dimorphilus gyrociliatus TaxID=2664684 RepID=A0A7I8W868_9ANNE|nr:DgyrCDS12435 [Dimorphilus gyrociliatus]